jgi:hypothetical protein
MRTVHSSSLHPELQQNFCRLHPPTLQERWQWLWQACIRKLAASNELKVWQKTDRQGRRKAWHVYDPTDNRVTCFGSELEVRLWLEQRYR